MDELCRIPLNRPGGQDGFSAKGWLRQGYSSVAHQSSSIDYGLRPFLKSANPLTSEG
jgi:hypothetical protein